jgi:hypothetical protein
MELMGSATRLRRGYGVRSIEGKWVAASGCGQRASFNGADGISDPPFAEAMACQEPLDDITFAITDCANV